MKYVTRTALITIAALLKVYITQDRNGKVNLWETHPDKKEDKGIWVIPGYHPINRESFVAPYTLHWDRSLITPKTKEYMEK